MVPLLLQPANLSSLSFSLSLSLSIYIYIYIVLSESRCALMKGAGVKSTSVYTVKTELNNYTLYRYCTSTAV
jgi:hypothetical protein